MYFLNTLHIAHWVESQGWVELGQEDYSSSWVRYGVGERRHKTVDQALRALEDYLAEMMHDWE